MVIDPVLVTEAIPDGFAILACGPEPMLDALARLGDRTHLPMQLAWEAPMACGYGACFGCAVRVDGVLAKLDGFLGEGNTQSLVAEAKATLESFKRAADSLNARIGPIADNLQRFSGGGLRNVEALVSETRQTVQSLQNTISDFDKNPSRLIFGGETVKQYDGRTRR